MRGRALLKSPAHSTPDARECMQGRVLGEVWLMYHEALTAHSKAACLLALWLLRPAFTERARRVASVHSLVV